MIFFSDLVEFAYIYLLISIKTNLKQIKKKRLTYSIIIFNIYIFAKYYCCSKNNCRTLYHI